MSRRRLGTALLNTNTTVANNILLIVFTLIENCFCRNREKIDFWTFLCKLIDNKWDFYFKPKRTKCILNSKQHKYLEEALLMA